MTQQVSDFEKIKKPLGRSITIGCVVFMAVMCLILGIALHFALKQSLYQRYEAYISDLLKYVDSAIDDDDLAQCVETLERSEKFNELELFMDSIKEDFNIHYLYIFRPHGSDKVMSVISAENHYDRYIDTEGNLYLGWISDDEYSEDIVSNFHEIMKKQGVFFFEEETEWGTDYTGALSLRDSSGRAYAILAVDVDITDIKKLVFARTVEAFALIVILGLLFIIMFLFWAKKNVTTPIRLLEESVVAFAKRSHGQRDVNALNFEAPEINTENEVESLSNAVTQMTEDMRDYVDDIISAEKKADMMSKLAKKDPLTGIRNKAGYDNEISRLKTDLRLSKISEFGIAMIDLNFLKKINDTYGHEIGNIAIRKLCHIVCDVFEHSPVFRIGGDEFVVILRGNDYKNAVILEDEFKENLIELSRNEELEEWERVSAAIGIACYDKDAGETVEDVFQRADQKMYECKAKMKACRE